MFMMMMMMMTFLHAQIFISFNSLTEIILEIK